MSSFTSYKKIDCHCHFIPPEYRTALEQNGHANPDGMPGIPPWSEEAHLELMSAANITRSIISISSPGVHLTPGNDALGSDIAKYCNDFASDLKKRRPESFGFFASLPLPDVEASLAEMRRVFDESDADGIVLETNHHGYYLGDSKFDAIFEELNRRHATVFIHPTTPCFLMQQSVVAATPLPQWPRPMFEFFFDSARAVINLFLSGTISRSPNVKFIISHMGGALPPMIRRFASIPGLLGLSNADPNVNPDFVTDRLNAQFYFDSAGWTFPEQIHGLLEHVQTDRLLYGSDYCYTNAEAAKALSDSHDKYLPEIFDDEEDREKLCWKNAEQLLAKSTRT